MMKRNVEDDNDDDDEKEHGDTMEMKDLSLRTIREETCGIPGKVNISMNASHQSLSSINLDGSDQSLIKVPYITGNGSILKNMDGVRNSTLGSLGKTREERIASLQCKPLKIQNKTRRPFSEIYAVDSCKLVYFFLLTLGICAALPYNLLVITDTYFGDFLETYVNTTTPQMAAMIHQFRPYLVVTSKIPIVLIVCCNTYITNGCCSGLGSFRLPNSLTRLWSARGCRRKHLPKVLHNGFETDNSHKAISLRRMIVMIVLMISASLLLLVCALMMLQEWMYIFAWMCIVFVIFLNVTGAVFQNTLFGVAFTLPRIYSNAVLIGMSMCGCLCYVATTTLIACNPPFRTLVLAVFIILILTLLTSLLISYILKNMYFFDYHMRKVVTPNWTSEINFAIPPRVCKLRFHKKVWLTGINLCLIHLTTSAGYPTTGAQVKRVNFPFPDKYWSLVFFYSVFNIFSLLGNILAQYLKLMRHRYIWLALVSRCVIFVPYYLFCNYKPEGYGNRVLPVYLENDYMFVLGTALMALTSGYYSSVCVMYAQYNTNREDCYLSGMLMNIMTYFGMFAGSLVSISFPYLTNDGKIL